MKIFLEVPDYRPDLGIKYNWEADFNIEVKYENGFVFLSANKAGLRSLANDLLNLAQEKILIGHHLHFDKNNSLEDDSADLIIEKLS